MIRKIPWPIYILLALIAASIISGLIVIRVACSPVVRGEFVELSVERVRLEVPRNWQAYGGEERMGDGVRYVFHFMSQNVAIGIIVYDLPATIEYLNRSEAENASQVLDFEINRIMKWYKESDENATINFIENGTLEVSGMNAPYRLFRIEKLRIGTLKILFIAFKDKGLVELVYIGLEKEWNENYDLFKHTLKSISSGA